MRAFWPASRICRVPRNGHYVRVDHDRHRHVTALVASSGTATDRRIGRACSLFAVAAVGPPQLDASPPTAPYHAIVALGPVRYELYGPIRERLIHMPNCVR